MERWERIIEQDNSMGVLANSDKDGKPAPPLKYRPKGGVLKRTSGGASMQAQGTTPAASTTT